MTRVVLDLDPRVIAKLRASANRRGVTIDIAAGELLAEGLRSRSPMRSRPSGDPGTGPVDPARAFGPIDVEYPDV